MKTVTSPTSLQIWSKSHLGVAMRPVNKFADVAMGNLLKAGEALGLARKTAATCRPGKI